MPGIATGHAHSHRLHAPGGIVAADCSGCMTGTKTLCRRHRVPSLLFGASLLAGCGDYPRDAENSTQRARSSVMRVGVSHDPPYVVLTHGADPRGDDIARVRALARTQGARIEWVTQGPSG